MFKFAADAGNSALKMIVEGVDEPILIPSVYSEHIEYGIEYGGFEDESVENILDYLDVTISTHSVMERKRLIIGSKVVRDGLVADYLPIGAKKSREPFPLYLILTGLGAAAIKLHPKKKKIRVEYEGGIALPVTQISPEEAAFAENRLEGSHTLIFHLPDGDITVDMHISFVKCAPEGAIAAYDLIYDFDGRVKNEDYLNIMIQHFSIGDGTTEMAVTQGVKYIRQLSRGIKIGVATPIDNIIHSFNQQYEYELRSRRHVVDIYLDKNHAHHDRLKKVADPHLRQLANLLSTQFTNQLRNAQDVSKIFVHGGGSIILRDHLKAIMSERGYDLDFSDDPVFTEVRGLMKFVLSPRYKFFRDKKLQEQETAASEDR